MTDREAKKERERKNGERARARIHMCHIYRHISSNPTVEPTKQRFISAKEPLLRSSAQNGERARARTRESESESARARERERENERERERTRENLREHKGERKKESTCKRGR